MNVEIVEGPDGHRAFSRLGRDVYDGNSCYRGTGRSVEQLLIRGPTAFHDRARVDAFLVRDSNDYVARFALIQDQGLTEYTQVAFFEARPGLSGLWGLIRAEIVRRYPGTKKVVVGLDGHLNYGAAFLLDRFDVPPVFGLPYTHPWYIDYFSELRQRRLVSFRFTMEEIHAWATSYGSLRGMNGITLRFMDNRSLASDVAHYTRLNNESFQDHPYWSNRQIAEDLELFHPFRHLLENENLIFAEHEGRPVAFYLWYPDFNQLARGARDLGLWEWLKFRCGAHIDTFRFTEVGILPGYRHRPLSLAMIQKSLPSLGRRGYEYCEGGFIFEENLASMTLVKRILKRAFGRDLQPFRNYAVFEGTVE